MKTKIKSVVRVSQRLCRWMITIFFWKYGRFFRDLLFRPYESTCFFWHANNKSHFEPKCFSHNEPESPKPRGSRAVTKLQSDRHGSILRRRWWCTSLSMHQQIMAAFLAGRRHCAYNQLALSPPPSFRLNADALRDFVHVSIVWKFCHTLCKGICEAEDTETYHDFCNETLTIQFCQLKFAQIATLKCFLWIWVLLKHVFTKKSCRLNLKPKTKHESNFHTHIHCACNSSARDNTWATVVA